MSDGKDASERVQVKDTRASTGTNDADTAKQTATTPEHSRSAEPAPEATGEPVPPIDFTTFVLSLSTSAVVHLGAIPDPQSGQHDVNLPLARQTIDLLALLEHKTAGNLTGEEERLLSQVLYDLRMQFVAASKKV